MGEDIQEAMWFEFRRSDVGCLFEQLVNFYANISIDFARAKPAENVAYCQHVTGTLKSSLNVKWFPRAQIVIT